MADGLCLDFLQRESPEEEIFALFLPTFPGPGRISQRRSNAMNLLGKIVRLSFDFRPHFLAGTH